MSRQRLRLIEVLLWMYATVLAFLIVFCVVDLIADRSYRNGAALTINTWALFYIVVLIRRRRWERRVDHRV